MAEVDIIELWNKGKRNSSGSEELDIERVLTKKSRTPLYWINIVLWIEFILNLISLPVVLIFYKEEDPVLYGIVMPVIIVIYLVYYQFLIQKIRAFDFNIDVKSGLQRLYRHLNFFFLHYKVVIWIFFPLAFAYAIHLAIKESGSILTTEKIWLMIGIALFFCVLAGLIFNFLVNLIYGRKIKRLKRIVQELDEGDE